MQCDLDNLRKIFAVMQADGFSTEEPLVYSYSFVNIDKAPLQELSRRLRAEGYEETELCPGINDEGWVLTLSRRETHTADTLHARNLALNQVADRCGVELYEGWDVSRE